MQKNKNKLIIMIMFFASAYFVSCVDDFVEIENCDDTASSFTSVSFKLPDGSKLSKYRVKTSIKQNDCFIDFGCDSDKSPKFIEPTCEPDPSFEYFNCLDNGSVMINLFSVQESFHISVESLDNKWYFDGDLSNKNKICLNFEMLSK